MGIPFPREEQQLAADQFGGKVCKRAVAGVLDLHDLVVPFGIYGSFSGRKFQDKSFCVLYAIKSALPAFTEPANNSSLTEAASARSA